MKTAYVLFENYAMDMGYDVHTEIKAFKGVFESMDGAKKEVTVLKNMKINAFKNSDHAKRMSKEDFQREMYLLDRNLYRFHDFGDSQPELHTIFEIQSHLLQS